MPGIVAHMGVAKTVAQKLNIKDDDFYRGNLLPDILAGDKSKTHYKIKGEIFSIPDIKYYKNNFNLNNYINLGYYTHLLLDYYFMNEFIPSITNDINIFHDPTIYEDYDKSNIHLIKYYNLDTDKLLDILKFNQDTIDKERLDDNLKYLVIKKEGETKYIKLEDFISFLDNSIERIIKELKTII